MTTAILLAGIAVFLFHPPCRAGLAEELLAEGDFAAARIEARRAELADPGNPTNTLIRALAAWRGGDARAADDLAGTLAAPGLSPVWRTRAALALAEARIREGRLPEAVDPLRLAFLAAPDAESYHTAAIALHALEHPLPGALDAYPGLALQVEASSPAWTPVRRTRVLAWFAPPAPARPPWLARGVVGFYRGQINPAIGQRCAMVPSCSEYFRQAAQRHGALLGVAMTTDRFFREPDHARLRLKPIESAGREKYLDPVDDHDFWMDP